MSNQPTNENQMVPATSPLPDSEDGMLDIEPTEGSEQRRQRLAQEFFNQVRSALGEFSSLREHLVASGHSIDQLGNRLIHDEKYLASVMNDSDNPSQRQETWHADDHEYYTRLHVTLVGAGMENSPIFLGTVYWTISRSSYGRGRFFVRFIPAS